MGFGRATQHISTRSHQTFGKDTEMPPVTALLKYSKPTFQAKVFPGSADRLYIAQQNIAESLPTPKEAGYP